MPSTLVKLARETTPAELQVGDLIRISMAKTTFEKGYKPNWTDEVFRINEVISRVPVVYRIMDLSSTF